jgi:hypothetical protein
MMFCCRHDAQHGIKGAMLNEPMWGMRAYRAEGMPRVASAASIDHPRPKDQYHAWLAKGALRGQWVETEHMPPFDRQPPELYSLAVEALAPAETTDFALT